MEATQNTKKDTGQIKQCEKQWAVPAARRNNIKTKALRHNPFSPPANHHMEFVMKQKKEIWHRYDYTLFSIQPYYTPFLPKFQAFLAKTMNFVDYDYIYVNIFMSTHATTPSCLFIIFDFYPIFRDQVAR